MAVASQKITLQRRMESILLGRGQFVSGLLQSLRCSYLIRFFDLILGALTAAPIIDEPVMKIPQAAPITHMTSAMAEPRLAK